MATNKRKTYFIDKRLQSKYIIHFFFLVIIGALLFTLFFSMTTAETWMVIYNNHDASPGSTPFLLIMELVKSNWALIVLALLVVVVLALFYSHKVAGPFYKFEKVLEDMRNGILDPNCKLRDKDDGQGVMEELQQTNLFFAQKVNELRSIAENLNETTMSDAHSKEAVANEAGRLQAPVDGFTIKE